MQIHKDATKGDLLLFADKVARAASSLPPGPGQQALLQEAREVRRVHQEQLGPLKESTAQTDRNLRDLRAATSSLEDRVSSTILRLESAQAFVTNNASAVIRQLCRKYVNSILAYFEHYLTWVRRSVTEEVAACKPVATALDSAIAIFLCSYVIDPLNVFWFGLGKATFLLLPALIFAVKLAKYYRRMQSEDVYCDF